jgi:hypothetical protein
LERELAVPGTVQQGDHDRARNRKRPCASSSHVGVFSDNCALLKTAKMAGWQPMEWSAGLAAVCPLTDAAARATDQHVHGPIEEQTRPACHPHIVLHFVNRTSQAWLKRVLRQETSEAKALLRRWQQQTLLFVESLMTSCAGLLPLHFREAPFPQVDLQSLPYFLTTGEICCRNIRGDIMVFNRE